MDDGIKGEWINAIHRAIEKYQQVGGAAYNTRQTAQNFLLGVQASKEELDRMAVEAGTAAQAAAQKVIDEAVAKVVSRLTNGINALNTNNAGVQQFNQDARQLTARCYGRNGRAREDIEAKHLAINAHSDETRGALSGARQDLTDAGKIASGLGPAVAQGVTTALRGELAPVKAKLDKVLAQGQHVVVGGERINGAVGGMVARAQQAIGEIGAL